MYVHMALLVVSVSTGITVNKFVLKNGSYHRNSISKMSNILKKLEQKFLSPYEDKKEFRD